MNEKRYFYFASTPNLAHVLCDKYENEIAQKRNTIINRLYKDAGGAIAHTENSIWGNAPQIAYLVFPANHALAAAEHIKVLDKRTHNDAPVVILGGRGNRKDGKAFNALIHQANKALDPLPVFNSWLIKKYDAMRTAIGDPSPTGRGHSMISSDAGWTKNAKGEKVLVMRIPKYTERVGDDTPTEETFTPPEGFHELTYGQFSDLLNN